MKKNHSSKSGTFNLRVLLTFTLCSVGALLAMLSFAPNPPSGTTTQVPDGQNDSPFVHKQAGPFSGGASPRPRAVRMPSGSATWGNVTSANTSTPEEKSPYGVTCILTSKFWGLRGK